MMSRYGVSRAFVFCLDEPDRHPSFSAANDRTLAFAERSQGRLIPFVRLDLNERDRKVQRFDDDRLEGGGIELSAGVRPEHAVRDFRQRPARQPRQLVGGHRLDCFRNVQPAVRAETLDERRVE